MISVLSSLRTFAMARLIIVTLFAVALTSIVKAESDPVEYGRPMNLHVPNTKIKMVDVVIFEPFWVTATTEVNSDEWWQKCYGPADLNDGNKGTLSSKLVPQVEFDRLADNVNGKLADFMKTYNKEKRQCTFNDMDFDNLKFDFESYAAKLRTIRETLANVNPKNDDIKRVYNHCEDMLQNLLAIKAVGQQQTIIGVMNLLKQGETMAGNKGIRFPNKIKLIPIQY
ncbi:uncharacterized protein LOC116346644 [Contarinia nasturtii]|uniref:uncharacterized protein LOC116346644 n=1 Tax=Contarinia nasturtii TaxID=265458 RepID=UPI0012D3BA28|nr:uncharacterized protein LOC116346644 [Contarinia nasturtii]